MYHDHDRSTFKDAAPVTTTTTKPRTFDTQLKWELSLALPHAGFGGVVGDILRVLIQLYDGEKGFAWPSEDFIAFMVKKDERTVRHHMPKVLASELFTKVRGRQHEANHYVLDWTVVDRLVPADRKGFAALCRAYQEQKQAGKRTKRKADRQDLPARPATFAVSDRQDLPVQTGEKLPAISLKDLSESTSLRGEQNEGCATASPPDRPRDALQDGPASNPRRFIPPEELGEAYARIVRAFAGNSDGDHSRAVALVLMKGYTVEQIVARMQPHNDRLATMADGRLHLLKFLRAEFDFDGRYAREEVSTLTSVPEVAEVVEVKVEPPQAGGSSYFNTPSMRRAAMQTREHVYEEPPF